MGATSGDVEAGFAKLQGEDFEYYMQTYSIILGRNSRHHARIFYDFARRRFALEVLGKNGCFVEGVLHLPGNPPVKLKIVEMVLEMVVLLLLGIVGILGVGYCMVGYSQL